MTDLKLEIGEGILLQTNDAGLYDGNTETEIDELYLTNKNIIYVHEKSTGFFKSETVVDRIPLSTIAVINGVVQVEQVDDDDYGKALQIIYTSGKRELLELNVSPKKQYPTWKETISNAVMILTAGTPTPQVVMTPPPAPVETVAPAVKEEKVGKTFAGATLFAGFKGVVDAAKQTFAEVSQTVTEIVVQPVENSHAVAEPEPVAVVQPINDVCEKKEGKFMFCSNCGTKLNEGAKFCHGCGTAVGTVTPSAPPAPPVVEQSIQPKPQERQQEYIGKILKCPHCGSPITERTVICPDCGIEITGRQAVSSVKSFKEQLMAIESERIGGFGGAILSASIMVDPADKKKLTLIQNFPIPNSIDDILEFMMLSIANIDIGLSKNTALNKWNKTVSSMESSSSIKRSISNAWVSKMQQAYQKAEILFPNDPAFNGIQKLYFDKMKELKIKI